MARKAYDNIEIFKREKIAKKTFVTESRKLYSFIKFFRVFQPMS